MGFSCFGLFQRTKFALIKNQNVEIMKKSRSILAVFLLLFLTAVSCDKSENISNVDLPGSAQKYMNKNFGDDNYTVEYDEDDHEYDVEVNNGFELTFNEDGDVVEIDGGHAAIPSDMLPNSIVDYVDEHFPNQYIVSWEQGANTQQVELSNDIDLIFDNDGDFIRLDD